MRCTTMPRTSELPFGSGRPRPYLYHQRAEQSMKVRTWEGDSTSATWLTGAAGCDACDGCWVMGDGAGTSSSSGGASNSENWRVRSSITVSMRSLAASRPSVGMGSSERRLKRWRNFSTARVSGDVIAGLHCRCHSDRKSVVEGKSVDLGG